MLSQLADNPQAGKVTIMMTNTEEQVDIDEQPLVIESRDKALTNIVVLERIIGFLPITDMRSCRLVNSSWLDIATAQLRKKDKGPLIEDMETVQSFLDFWGLQDDGIEFEQQTGAPPPPRPPFTRIALNLDRMDCAESMLDRLFLTMAPFIAEINLTVSVDNHRYQFKNDDVYQNLSYPNLSKYCCHLDGFNENGDDGGRYGDLICGILINAPNLRELQYYGDSDYNNAEEYFDWVIDTLKERKCGNKKLKMFGTYSGGMTDLHFKRMANELALSLETFHMSTGEDELLLGPDDDGLFRFLEGQGGSLKCLDLRCVTGLFEYRGVPKLEKLESLSVEGWKPLPHRLAPTIVPSVNYQANLPILKKIKFTDYNNDEWIHFLPRLGSPAVESLEELNLPAKLKSGAHIEHCVRSFPNLKTLRIPATFPYLCLVCKELPQLEELILDTSEVTNIDHVITGFTVPECELIGRFTDTMLRRMPLQFTEDHPEEVDSVRVPISVLKNLKILRLRPRFQPNKIELTKVSSRLVLAKMESLQILDLSHRTKTALNGFEEVIKDMEEAGKVVEYRAGKDNDDDASYIDAIDDILDNVIIDGGWRDHLEDAMLNENMFVQRF